MISPPLPFLFAPLAWMFGQVATWRSRMYASGAIARERLTAPVISVGNLVVGGTGKTPLVIWLARRLTGRGLRVAVLSRGYRRRGTGIEVVADAAGVHREVDHGGDEPVLIARAVPGVAVVVGADRAAAGRAAEERFAPDVHLLDDGFQHLRLVRQLDLVILDATRDPTRLRLLPAGPLREPLPALARADAIVVSRAHRERDPRAIDALVRAHNPTAPILRMRSRFTGLLGLDGTTRPTGWLAGRRVLALSAIGNPAAFEADLGDLGAEIAATLRYRDHHRFRARDLDRIEGLLQASGAELVVTTAKDLIRLERSPSARLPILALTMEAEIDGPAPLDALLDGLLPARALAGSRS